MNEAHRDETSNWSNGHFAQQVSSQKFETFYKEGQPKEWPIENLKPNKIAIFYGDNDMYNSIEDIQLIRNNFEKNAKFKLDYRIPCTPWEHNEYIMANDAGKCFVGKFLQLLNQLKY